MKVENELLIEFDEKNNTKIGFLFRSFIRYNFYLSRPICCVTDCG